MASNMSISMRDHIIEEQALEEIFREISIDIVLGHVLYD